MNNTNTLRASEDWLKNRIVLLSGVAGYVLLFQWMYANYLYPNWDYYGFHFNPPPTTYVMLAWVLSMTPALWMPMKLTRPSQLSYWILYLTVLIPSMFVPFYAGLNSPDEISPLALTLFGGFAIIGCCYVLPLLHLRFMKVSRRTFWKGFACLAGALALWLIMAYSDHLQILSFNDLYGLRDIQNEVSKGSLVNFAFMLLCGAFHPFLMGYGLFHRRRWLFLLGALGQLLIYSVGGTKGSILSIAFVLGFYLLFKSGRQPFSLKLVFSTLALVGGLCSSYAAAGYDPAPLGIHWVMLFVVLMRTFGSNALMTAWYYNFFQSNPHTFYSHAKGVSWLVHYPYTRSVALEIGSVYMPAAEDGDPTAHFWATDGIGAMGLPGILIISAFCGLVFWALDSAARMHDPRLGALVTCYAAYNIANISIFTTLYSGGLALLLVGLYLLAPEREKTVESTAAYVIERQAMTRRIFRRAPTIDV